MKINPISLCKYNAIPQKNISSSTANPIFKGYSRDTFVKNINENLLSNYYASDLEKFREEATEYILNSPKITYGGLDNIVKKYSPKTRVEQFQNEGEKSKKSNAMYEEEIIQRTKFRSIKETIQNKKIKVTIPSNQDREARLDLLIQFVHEAVHMFQSDARKEVLESSFYKQYYKNRKMVNQKTSDAITSLEIGYTKFEQNMFTLLGHFLNSNKNRRNLYIDDFDKYLANNHNMNFKNIVKFLIEDTYCEDGGNIINTLGEDAILDFVKFKVEKELEAYKIADEINSEYCTNHFKKIGRPHV